MTPKLQHKRKSSPSNEDLADRLSKSEEWAQQAESSTPAAVGPFPWDEGNPRIKTAYNFRMDEVLHLKLKFLVQNEPNTSMQSIIHEAVEDEVNRRLMKYMGGQHAGKGTAR